MHLLHPNMLWLLVALLPLLWWLSQPPKPKRTLWTAHLPQWQQAMKALRRRPPRGSWLRFALLACAAVAATVAASGPVTTAAPGKQRLVVLLDASASMASAGTASEGKASEGRASEGKASERVASGSRASGSRAAGSEALSSGGENAGEAPSPTCFEQAVALARETLAAVPPHVDVTVLRCGGDLRRRHGAAARALTDLGAPAGPLGVDLRELAEGLADAQTEVWTLTDGQGSAEPAASLPTTWLDGRGANAALVDVAIEDRWPLASLHLTVRLVAFGADQAAQEPAEPRDGAERDEQEVELELRVAGSGLLGDEVRRRVRVLAGAVATTAGLDIERTAAGGALVVQLRMPGDRLPTDDVRRFELPPLPAPRIAVFAEGDAGPFAAVAAEALADEVAGEVIAPEVAAGQAVGLLLVDGGAIPMVPGSVRALTFGSRLMAVPAAAGDSGAGRRAVGNPGEGDPATRNPATRNPATGNPATGNPASENPAPEPWPAPQPIEWSRTSPLTRGLDLSELRLERAWLGLLPPAGPGVEPFLWADVGAGASLPLACLVRGPRGVASVHFAFRLQDGNLPLLAAFPQLLRRAFVASYGEAGAVLPAVRSGSVANAVPPRGERDLRARSRPAAAGATSVLEPPPLGPFAQPPRPLARWFVLAGLIALGLRAWFR
ncbi:MAG: hypothetical protein AB8H80_07645 [Planctomycetota bacterium]